MRVFHFFPFYFHKIFIVNFIFYFFVAVVVVVVVVMIILIAAMARKKIEVRYYCIHLHNERHKNGGYSFSFDGEITVLTMAEERPFTPHPREHWFSQQLSIDEFPKTDTLLALLQTSKGILEECSRSYIHAVSTGQKHYFILRSS